MFIPSSPSTRLSIKLLVEIFEEVCGSLWILLSFKTVCKLIQNSEFAAAGNLSGLCFGAKNENMFQTLNWGNEILLWTNKKWKPGATNCTIFVEDCSKSS